MKVGCEEMKNIMSEIMTHMNIDEVKGVHFREEQSYLRCVCGFFSGAFGDFRHFGYPKVCNDPKANAELSNRAAKSMSRFDKIFFFFATYFAFQMHRCPHRRYLHLRR